MPINLDGAVWRRVRTHLPADYALEEATHYLSSREIDTKAVIRVFEAGQSTPDLILKTSACNRPEEQALADEFHALTALQALADQGHDMPFSTPRPLDFFLEGGQRYMEQTLAVGKPISELIFLQHRRRRIRFLHDEMSRCVEVGSGLSQTLRQRLAARPVNPSWYKAPESLALGSDDRHFLATIAHECVRRDSHAHGDFTIENVYWDRASGQITVIDWELPMRGVPRLYDAFVFLFSSLPAMALEEHRVSTESERLPQQFRESFFGTGVWAAATRAILHRIAPAVPHSESECWGEMLMSLVIRTNYFLWRAPALGQQYLRLIDCALQHKSSFVGRTTSGSPLQKFPVPPTPLGVNEMPGSSTI